MSTPRQVAVGAVIGACMWAAAITFGVSFGRGSLQVGAFTLIPFLVGAFFGGMTAWSLVQGRRAAQQQED